MMMRLRIAFLAALIAFQPLLAVAADNAVILTPGVGVTMRSVDVGSGVQSMMHILGDSTGTAIYGTAGTANANVLTVQGRASMTPVQVSQATAASLNATVVGTGTFVTQSTLAAETTKVIGTVRMQGNIGGVMDFIGQNATAPANALQTGCQFQTSPTTITAGNSSPCQMDNAGNILVNVKTATGLAAGSTTSGQTGSLIMGAVTTAAPTYTTAQTNYVSLDTHGGVRIGGAGYPAGATPITISATGTTGATTATLATGASVTTYICGFSIRANATAAATANSTVTGTITGTLNYTQWTAPNASGIGLTEQVFIPCVPASAVNTGIAVISAAPGTGGVVSVTAWGFTL